MSQISQIRSIIQDKPVYRTETVVFDGTGNTYQTSYFPILSSSVIITPAPDTIDEQSGVLTWNTAPSAGSVELAYSFVMLLDADIQDFIDIESLQADVSTSDLDVRLAAADALDAIASSQALIQKKIKILDLETDGPALAKALRDHAVTLRKQVFDQDFVEGGFDIAELVYDDPSWLEKVIKDRMRQS